MAHNWLFWLLYRSRITNHALVMLFAAGILYGLHEDWPLAEIVNLGHAAAAASVRSLGTTDAGMSWQECVELASTWGWRTATYA